MMCNSPIRQGMGLSRGWVLSIVLGWGMLGGMCAFAADNRAALTNDEQRALERLLVPGGPSDTTLALSLHDLSSALTQGNLNLRDQLLTYLSQTPKPQSEVALRIFNDHYTIDSDVVQFIDQHYLSQNLTSKSHYASNWEEILAHAQVKEDGLYELRKLGVARMRKITTSSHQSFATSELKRTLEATSVLYANPQTLQFPTAVLEAHTEWMTPLFTRPRELSIPIEEAKSLRIAGAKGFLYAQPNRALEQGGGLALLPDFKTKPFSRDEARKLEVLMDPYLNSRSKSLAVLRDDTLKNEWKQLYNAALDSTDPEVLRVLAPALSENLGRHQDLIAPLVVKYLKHQPAGPLLEILGGMKSRMLNLPPDVAGVLVEALRTGSGGHTERVLDFLFSYKGPQAISDAKTIEGIARWGLTRPSTYGKTRAWLLDGFPPRARKAWPALREAIRTSDLTVEDTATVFLFLKESRDPMFERLVLEEVLSGNTLLPESTLSELGPWSEEFKKELHTKASAKKTSLHRTKSLEALVLAQSPLDDATEDLLLSMLKEKRGTARTEALRALIAGNRAKTRVWDNDFLLRIFEEMKTWKDESQLLLAIAFLKNSGAKSWIAQDLALNWLKNPKIAKPAMNALIRLGNLQEEALPTLERILMDSHALPLGLELLEKITVVPGAEPEFVERILNAYFFNSSLHGNEANRFRLIIEPYRNLSSTQTRIMDAVHNSRPIFRRRAVQLGLPEDAGGIAGYVRFLEKERDPFFRAIVMERLGQFKDLRNPALQKVILDAVLDESNSYVQAKALDSLKLFPNLDSALIPTALERYPKASPSVAEQLARAIRSSTPLELSEAMKIPKLMRKYKEGATTLLGQALFKQPGNAALTLELLPLLKDRDERVVWEAVSMLEKHGPFANLETQQAIVDLMTRNVKDEKIRAATAKLFNPKAMGHIHGQPLKTLTQALERESSLAVRETLASKLIEWAERDPGVLTTLQEQLHRVPESLSARATQVLEAGYTAHPELRPLAMTVSGERGLAVPGADPSCVRREIESIWSAMGRSGTK